VELPSEALQILEQLQAVDPSEEHPSAVLQSLELHPSEALQMLALLPVVDPSEEPPSVVLRKMELHPFVEGRPSLVLQMLELRVEVLVLAPEPTATSSDYRPELPRKNLHLHQEQQRAVALHIRPYRPVKREEVVQCHQDSSSAERDILRSSPEVLEAHRHLNHLHQPLEAAALHLRRPRTRHTYCRACPCP
jgi:hypothetical protein